MVQKIAKKRKIHAFFGTTQTDPEYARKLAHIIPASTLTLMDGFCERTLSPSCYKTTRDTSKIINLSTDKGKEELYDIIDKN